MESPIDSCLDLYVGDGEKHDTKLPLSVGRGKLDDPAGYLADEGLRNAVNAALTLELPLLLTGEPGTGKSLLAYSLALELDAGVPDESGRPAPLVFHCKTTSTATDLFYRYDALRHFHDANRRDHDMPTTDTYIEYEALGLAILLASSDYVRPLLPERLRKVQRPKRCIVLADEIDKAPRDLPNDILNEVERMTFTVKETRRTFKADEKHRPVLILTSNSERDLPDAFLRRCAFYHVPFPTTKQMIDILSRRLDPPGTSPDLNFYAAIVMLFEEIRGLKQLRKKPATAELIAWAQLLAGKDVTVKQIEARSADQLLPTVVLLAKNSDDRRFLIEWIRKR